MKTEAQWLTVVLAIIALGLVAKFGLPFAIISDTTYTSYGSTFTAGQLGFSYHQTNNCVNLDPDKTGSCANVCVLVTGSDKSAYIYMDEPVDDKFVILSSDSGTTTFTFTIRTLSDCTALDNDLSLTLLSPSGKHAKASAIPAPVPIINENATAPPPEPPASDNMLPLVAGIALIGGAVLLFLFM